MNKIKMNVDKKKLINVAVVVMLCGMALAIQILVSSQSKLLSDSQNAQLILEKGLADCRAGNVPQVPLREGAPLSVSNGGNESQNLPVYNNVKSENQFLAPSEAAKVAVDYINRDLLAEGSTADSNYKASEVSGVYKFVITVSGKDYDTYVTKDGKIMFAQAHKVTATKEGEPTAAKSVAETAAKTDKPDVKVFVMSYCPYGLQAQKMYWPVYDVLKNKATMGIYFVDYAMHGQKELDENLRQYCIQKNQPKDYPAYLKCFTTSQPGADGLAGYDACMAAAGIDKTKVAECVKSTDEQFGVTKDYNDKSTWVNGKFPKFTVSGDLNTKYGVQGSPTIIINGEKASITTRSPQNFLKAICDTFTNKPEECMSSLSNEAASVGFGGGTSASSSGGCGG